MKPADLDQHCFLKRLYLGSAGQVLNTEKYWLGLWLYALAKFAVVMVNMIKFTAVMSKFTANFTQTYSPSSS